MIWVLIAALFVVATMLAWWVIASQTEPSEFDRARREFAQACDQLQAEIGAAFLPVIERTVAGLNEWLKSKP